MLKAIETVYNGYRFRSRLEARWAVFFDTLGVKYEYEKEGYDLDGVWYLPDFWLPELNCWVEIKGQKPTDEERYKAMLLSEQTRKYVYIFFGDCWVPNFADIDSVVYYGIEGMDHNHVWCECPYCHKIGIEFQGREARLCDCEKKIRGTDYGRGGNYDSPRLVAAYTAARQARFERGR